MRDAFGYKHQQLFGLRREGPRRGTAVSVSSSVPSSVARRLRAWMMLPCKSLSWFFAPPLSHSGGLSPLLRRRSLTRSLKDTQVQVLIPSFTDTKRTDKGNLIFARRDRLRRGWRRPHPLGVKVEHLVIATRRHELTAASISESIRAAAGIPSRKSAAHPVCCLP